MITGIHVKNFKCLADFKLENLDKFTCVIGLNGSGKTTLLQLFETIAFLAEGKDPPWLNETFLTKDSASPEFEVNICFDNQIAWRGQYDVKQQVFSVETVMRGNHPILHASRNILVDQEGNQSSYKGSRLSNLITTDPTLSLVRNSLRSLKNIGLLSPTAIGQEGTREVEEISKGGIGLPGFLSHLSDAEKKELKSRLCAFYFESPEFRIKHLVGGWKDLFFKDKNGEFHVSATNDGLIRALAILSQRYTKHNFVFFDEIENGFNQELIEKLVNELLDFNGKQVMVTTHSAVILNYLSDEIAKQSVILLYKEKQGYTQARRFFEIPAVFELLEVMGPGQVMSRTNLEELVQSLI